MAYPFPSSTSIPSTVYSPSAHSQYLATPRARSSSRHRSHSHHEQYYQPGIAYTHSVRLSSLSRLRISFSSRSRAIIIAVHRALLTRPPTPHTAIPPNRPILYTTILLTLLIISPSIPTLPIPTTLTPTPSPLPTTPPTTTHASAHPPSPIVFVTFLASIVTIITTTTISLITSLTNLTIISPIQTIVAGVTTPSQASGMTPDSIGTILSAQGRGSLARLITGAILMSTAGKSITAEESSTGCSAFHF